VAVCVCPILKSNEQIFSRLFLILIVNGRRISRRRKQQQENEEELSINPNRYLIRHHTHTHTCRTKQSQRVWHADSLLVPDLGLIICCCCCRRMTSHHFKVISNGRNCVSVCAGLCVCDCRIKIKQEEPQLLWYIEKKKKD
jgi:hypothetical protein